MLEVENRGGDGTKVATTVLKLVGGSERRSREPMALPRCV